MPEDYIKVHTAIQGEVNVGLDEIDKDDYMIFINYHHERMDLTLDEAVAMRTALNYYIKKLMGE